MIVFPAIDLRHGQVVRLRQGQPEALTAYSDDPAATAARWQVEGAEWLHVVNLDGALGAADARANLAQLRAICRGTALKVQFGGGLRRLADVDEALNLGAARVVLGTVAVQQPELVAEAVLRFGAERIVVGLDARDGRVAVSGWQDVTALTPLAVAERLRGDGVLTLLYTDIARDGMLTGVNVEATALLAESSGLAVIASGGVAGIEDIVALKAREDMGIEGVIVGQALYTGRLRLADALAVAAPLARDRG